MSNPVIPDWPAPIGVEALVTTRSCTLDSVAEQLPDVPLWLEQVHGTAVVDVDGLSEVEHLPRGDAALTRNPGRVLAIRTADCLPVMFCHRHKPLIAAAHAGWRGLAAGVLEAAVEAMAVEAGEVLAWLGPAISQQAFEVGPEVRQLFIDQNVEARSAFVPGRADRWNADLYALARQRLESVGVRNIYGGGFCTYTDSERFPSYRRDPDCGRMVSLIWMDALAAPT